MSNDASIRKSIIGAYNQVLNRSSENKPPEKPEKAPLPLWTQDMNKARDAYSSMLDKEKKTEDTNSKKE